MEIKTIKQALRITRETIEDYFKENVEKIEEKGEKYGIIHTRYSIFFVNLINTTDRLIKKYFPDLSQQIMWDESIRLSKSLLLDFVNTPNMERKRLSMLFVLKDGQILQISPLSMLNFCEAAKLEIEEDGVYYVFPTIFLKKIKGDSSKKEKTTRDNLSIISQINSIEEFDSEDQEISAVIRDFDVDLFGEIIRTLRNIEYHLENIEQFLKRKK